MTFSPNLPYVELKIAPGLSVYCVVVVSYVSPLENVNVPAERELAARPCPAKESPPATQFPSLSKRPSLPMLHWFPEMLEKSKVKRQNLSASPRPQTASVPAATSRREGSVAAPATRERPAPVLRSVPAPENETLSVPFVSPAAARSSREPAMATLCGETRSISRRRPVQALPTVEVFSK